MNGDSVALDTNWAVEILNGVTPASEQLRDYRRIVLPVTVFGELIYGALNSARAEENVAKVEDLCRKCYLAPAGDTVARRYAHLQVALKRKGRPIPINDMWIAAICLVEEVAIATSDAHFDSVDGLAILRPLR